MQAFQAIIFLVLAVAIIAESARHHRSVLQLKAPVPNEVSVLGHEATLATTPVPEGTSAMPHGAPPVTTRSVITPLRGMCYYDAASQALLFVRSSSISSLLSTLPPGTPFCKVNLRQPRLDTCTSANIVADADFVKCVCVEGFNLDVSTGMCVASPSNDANVPGEAPLVASTLIEVQATTIELNSNTSADDVHASAIVGVNCADQWPATCWAWKDRFCNVADGYYYTSPEYGCQYVTTQICPLSCGRCSEYMPPMLLAAFLGYLIM